MVGVRGRPESGVKLFGRGKWPVLRGTFRLGPLEDREAGLAGHEVRHGDRRRCRVELEGLAVLDADCREEAKGDRIASVRRLGLNHAVEQFPELIVARPDRDERLG